MNNSIKILFIGRHDLRTQAGGDAVHMDQHKIFLEQLGFDVQIALVGEINGPKEVDIIHFFNLGRPADYFYFSDVKAKARIVSSIFVDYSQADKEQSFARRAISKSLGKYRMEFLKTLAKYKMWGIKIPPDYVTNGHKGSIQNILSSADHVITASNAELNHIETSFNVPKHSCIYLGSEHILASTDIDAPEFDIICIARIEPLKNQLRLIKACAQANLTLLIVGNAGTQHLDYYQKCILEAKGIATFMDYQKPEDLSSIYALAKVHALCSLYETTGLVSIEAMKCGLNILVSHSAIQEELFEDKAAYCEPTNIDSIAEGLKSALSQKEKHTEWLQQKFSWKSAANQLSDIYLETLTQKS